MWLRKAEGGVGGVPGGIDSRDAAALGWQVDAERAVSESRRWESLAKDGEAAADQRESELGQLKAQNQIMREQLNRLTAHAQIQR